MVIPDGPFRIDPEVFRGPRTLNPVAPGTRLAPLEPNVYSYTITPNQAPEERNQEVMRLRSYGAFKPTEPPYGMYAAAKSQQQTKGWSFFSRN